MGKIKIKRGYFAFHMIKPISKEDMKVKSLNCENQVAEAISRKRWDMLEDISNRGFKILALKIVKMTLAEAEKFYEIHKSRPFYESLVKYMSSGEVVVMILGKENAVQELRKALGNTNPELAEENTIRAKFGINIEQNASHGSDSDENAEVECGFFFDIEVLR